jgi:23S rRNA (pseudouridine1915-N3)-methyltransferase
MHITLLCTGKTEESYLKEGIELYSKRISHYLPFRIIELPVQKKWASLPPPIVKAREGEQILKHLGNSDFCVLLDEKGKLFDSRSFSEFIQLKMNRSVKNLFFVVGGAWGFSEEVYHAAHMKMSLSPMTFPHQLVRLFFAEQLYRAMTIWRNESYHND